MTTATATTVPTETVTTAPVEADPTSIFYDMPDVAAPVAPVSRQADPEDQGLTVTPTEASTVSPEGSAEPAPVGTEPEKAAEKAEKPDDQKGHAAAARRLGQEVAELKKQFAMLAEEKRVLQAKLDGTYEEPAQPTQEEITARAEFKGRETASRMVAEERFGKEDVETLIYAEDSPYKQLVKDQPWLHARVVKHAQPAVEAIRVIREQEFMQQYGSDPTQWKAKIEAEITPRLLKELQSKLVQPATGKPAPTVTTGRGTGSANRALTAEEVFYAGPTA